jgi:tRNA pseudouridine55 synthase
VTEAGVLVLDKERGPTSHDVVARVRRQRKTREVGHAGTLDPMATGVLVIAVGEATKLVPWLTAHDKSYIATIRFGIETTTFDAEGTVVRECPVDLAGLDAAIAAERARTEQIPPAVSAIKIDGVAAHARVRRGEEVTMAARPVVVRRLEVTRIAEREIDIALDCGKGYYVRSLARDLAAHLGTVAHLTMLRRTASGPFSVNDASDNLIPLAEAASRAIAVSTLTDDGAIRAGHGKVLSRADFVEVCDGVSAWLHGGKLIAVGELVSEEARVVRGFREAFREE